MGSDGASCFHTLTSDTRDVPKAQWDSERFGLLCTDATAFANWKAAIEKLCNKTRLCDYSTKVAIRAFFDRVDLLNSRIAQSPR